MDRPRPVPPYLRVVEESAWAKGENRVSYLLWAYPDSSVGDGETHCGRTVFPVLERHMQPGPRPAQ